LECGGKVAFELGVCFELGLGTRRSPEMARLWISKSQQSYDDLEQLKTQMKTAQWGFKNSSEVQQNIAIGVLDPVSLTHETMGQGDNYPALRDRYLEEIEDLDASLGHCNKLSNHIRLVLANAAANQDDYALAKSLLKEVMSSPNFKAVRPDNPFAMGIFQHLASTLQGLGELEEAESVALKALGGNLETFLAPGHHMLFNIRSAGHLASIWSERGKYAQAATLHKRVSKAYARELGNNHFMTIESKVELAGALFAAGDSDAARALSLGLLVQLLGNDFNNLSTNLMDDLVLSTARFKMEMSIWVMLLCTNMGMVALEREKYIEAEWFHTSALRVSHVVLSREDSGKPQFLDTVNLLPLSRGEPLQHFPPTASRIITERPRPVVLIRASNLAMVYIDLPEYRALAEHLLRGAMEGWNLYGSHNPGLYATMGSLSMLLYNKGDFDEAESLCRQALEGRVALGGNDSVDTIECLSNLCVIKHGQKDYAAAEVLQRRVLEAREKSFGPDHPITFNSVSMLADILSQREQWDIAEPLFRKALDGFTRHFGCEHRETLKCKSMLSLQLQVLGSYAEAEILNKEALAVYERIYGSSDNETLISMNNLAVIFAEQNLYEKALPLYKEVVRRMVDSRGDEDLEALQAKMDYVAVLRYSGRYEEAMSLHRVVLEARTRILGESDAATQESMDAVRYDMPGPLCAEQL
jgi:tetratricopeptide (TPR) repeat protein